VLSKDRFGSPDSFPYFPISAAGCGAIRNSWSDRELGVAMRARPSGQFGAALLVTDVPATEVACQPFPIFEPGSTEPFAIRPEPGAEIHTPAAES
jgi:hypothetical protein